MILVIEKVLSAEELGAIRRLLENARFVDGAPTAVGDARAQKHVLQLDRAGDAQREPGEIVVRALLKSSMLQAAALPKSTRHPSINRYEPGMYYGPHLDSPLMTGTVTTRADLSATVFLNEPGDYQGGELCIHADKTPLEFKGRAGDAVLYSADSIHQVKPVTAGVRLVAVTWFQSLVRGEAQRRILFDLKSALDALDAQAADAQARIRLQASYSNLLRLWIEP